MDCDERMRAASLLDVFWCYSKLWKFEFNRADVKD